ncbi:MAG: hypothetical protein Q8N71_00295 [candidate division Zixibacteria bacterium]|nr:hypothetical protein [candidate division Zixibacteria bacterium]
MLQYFIDQSGITIEVFKKYLTIEQNYFIKLFEKVMELIKKYLLTDKK